MAATASVSYVAPVETAAARGVKQAAGHARKWEQCVEREINGGNVDEVWAILGKFGGLKRWVRSVEVCELVEGEEGEPGCVRYLSGGGTRPDGTPERWVKEILLEWHDAPVRSFTYAITDSSYGIRGYLATLSVIDINCSNETGSLCYPHHAGLPVETQKCVVRWHFSVEPVPHSTKENITEFFSAIFHRMMGNLESVLATTHYNINNYMS